MEADMTFKEIAELQGISINTALARMQYALTKMRTELRPLYGPGERTL
jgi:DNA-directed RNA polymerase specialized sigma24 family protein